MSADVVPFSSPELMGQGGSINQPANRRSIARTVDNEITMCIERIEEYAKQLWRLIKRMDEEELWRDLGFATYRDYLNSVRERTSRVPAALRAPIRKQLEAEGASNREIAAATGTTARTVINDRNRERQPTPQSNAQQIAEVTAQRMRDGELSHPPQHEPLCPNPVVEIADAEIVQEPNCPMRDTVVRLEGIVQYIGSEAPPEIRIEVSKMLRREADRMDPRKPRNHTKGQVMN